MGKVFTWEDVAERRVPNKNDFPYVCTQIQRAFIRSSAIKNAVLFGSVVNGSFSVRSDIDVLYQYWPEQAEEAAKVTNELALKAKKLHISIDFQPCNMRVAKTPLHFFGPLFERHLKRSAQEHKSLIKGGSPCFENSVPISQEIESYLRSKVHSLDEARSQIVLATEEDVAKLLKKTLEAPVHVARKMLEYREVLGDDSKRKVVEQYRNQFPKGLADELDRLVSLDARYTVALIDQLANPDEDRYRQILSQLLTEVTSVLDFLYGNIEYLTRH